MSMLWVPLAAAAAAFQTGRNTTSKSLTKRLRPNTVSFVRFFFALPFAVTYLLVLLRTTDASCGTLTYSFGVYITLAALFQIAGSSLLVSLFTRRSFGTAVILSRTEAIQAALFGALFFGEEPTLIGWNAIAISTVGMILLSAKGSTLAAFFSSLRSSTALLGLGCGFAFGVAVSFTPIAIGSLEGGSYAANAALALVLMLAIQSLSILLWLLLRDRGQIATLTELIVPSVITGTLSACGSLAWFTAFTLAPAPYVRTVGQVEILFSAALSRFAFSEKTTKQELLGMTLTAVGILVLLIEKGMSS